MLGAIIGDLVGSVYEHNPIKTKDFEFFSPFSEVTDDSLLTVATMEALMTNRDFSKYYRKYYRLYPNAGYGSRFIEWAVNDDMGSYGSYGNGSAMRVSPCAYMYDSLEQVEDLACMSAEVTHNHEEGLKGAKAIAVATYLAKSGASKERIKAVIEERYGYDLSRDYDSVQAIYDFDVTCMGSVPEAIISFLDSNDFEDAIRNAVALGGDADTLAAMTGAIAEAFYGIPKELLKKSFEYLDNRVTSIIKQFYTMLEMHIE